MAQSLTTKKGKLRKSTKKKIVKSASKAIGGRKTKTEKNIIKIGKALVRKKTGLLTKQPNVKGLKQATISRRSISQRNISEDKLKELVRDYAKAANKRLRNLEKAGVQEASAAYRQIRTYSRDDRSFMGTTRNGEFKFKTDTRKMTREELQREAMELDTFLFRAKTSTVRGVKAHYRRIKEAIGRQNLNDTKSQRVMDYFNKMSMEEFNQFWENQSMSAMIEMYGSDEVIKLIQEGEDEGFDIEKMDELFTNILNDQQKSKSITALEERIRHDRAVNFARDVNQSTEPRVGVDEDGFMTLF